MSNSGKGAAPITGLLSGKPLSKEQIADAIREGEARKRRTRRYTGDLAEPIEHKQLLVHGLGLGQAWWLSANDVQATNRRTEMERDAEFERRLLLLFKWHEVSPFDWRGLSLELARAHVPGLQVSTPKRKRGRPRKTPIGPIMGLLDPRLFPSKGKAGAPVRWTPERQRRLVAVADDWRQTEKANGKRASDRGFVLWMCAQHAARTGERVAVVVKRNARALANALSRARKAVSKP